MPFVQGPPLESGQAPRGYIDPRTDPESYQDYDNLGFSLARFKINSKSFTRPLATVKKNALPILGTAAALFVPIPGVGMLAPKLLGAAKGLVGGIVNKVTGGGPSSAPAPTPVPSLDPGIIQRMATTTFQQPTAPLVNYQIAAPSPLTAPGVAVVAAPALPAAGAPVVQRVSTATSLLDWGAKLRAGAAKLAGGVTNAGSVAGRLASAADQVAAAGDMVGSQRLKDAAAKIAELARTGQDTTGNVANVINQAGAGAQGAMQGAIAGVAAEQASQGLSAFFGSTTGKVAMSAVAIGLGILFVRGTSHGGSSAQNYRRAGGDSRQWE